MNNFGGMLCLAIAALAAGCSADAAKRSTYETLQNVREQECLKNPAAENCGKRDSYEDYQRQRKELDQSNISPDKVE